MTSADVTAEVLAWVSPALVADDGVSVIYVLVTSLGGFCSVESETVAD